MTAPPRPHPVVLQAASGLRFEVNANGSIRRIDHGDVVLNAYLGSEIEGGPANVYLRSRGESPRRRHRFAALLGPTSPGSIALDERGLAVSGEWDGIAFSLSLVLAESAAAWFWHVALANTGRAARTVDLVYAQDVALAQYGALRNNEYYTSQYVDHTPLVHPEHGPVLAVRQNLKMGEHHPWALIGSIRRAASWATDALQLHGLATRAGGAPVALAGELPGKRLQHEHSMAVIQESPIRLDPGATAHCGFFAWFLQNHPEASSEKDLAAVAAAVALAAASPPGAPARAP